MKKPIRVKKLKDLSMEELCSYLGLDALNQNTLIFFTTERPIAQGVKREPMFFGCMTHALENVQWCSIKPIKGDTVWDVDLGMFEYDGEGEGWCYTPQLTMRKEKGY
jgi:hypothetical protein